MGDDVTKYAQILHQPYGDPTTPIGVPGPITDSVGEVLRTKGERDLIRETICKTVRALINTPPAMNRKEASQRSARALEVAIELRGLFAADDLATEALRAAWEEHLATRRNGE